ncbi:speriolin [Brachionus plicatilis]|uniref:Speriolin n=1 Tax=Brachionus plicatilis TaxID=10195 RepID=A0A3M7PLY5_BRAPC|nr:speriolin [Brachionus plicatilis]
MKEVVNFGDKTTKDVQSKSKSTNKTSLFKSPLIKLQIEHANSVKELKKLERNSSIKKSKINFIERNKSISRFKKHVVLPDHTHKKFSKLFVPVRNNLNKSAGKKSPNEKKIFRQRFRIVLKFRKNLAKFFSSIFARIFHRTKFKQVKSKSKPSKAISNSKDWISEKEANSQSSSSNSAMHSPKNSNQELNYSNECEVPSTDFYQVNHLECEKFEIEILKISINQSFNFNQVSIRENTIFEHIVEKKSSENISIQDSLSSQSENQIIECRKSSSSKIRNETLGSNSLLELRSSIDESNREDNIGPTSKFENNLMNLYETHQKIVDKYLKSNLDEQSDENCSKTFLIVPSLYEKYGFHLVNLFKSQVDEPFLPYYVDPRLVGECLYQLDQRVFSYVFRLTPFNRRNIREGYQPFDIISTAEHFSNESGLDNEKKFSTFMNRYNYLMKSFHEIGYKDEEHPNMAAYLIMKYGLYPCLPIDFQINCKDYSQFEILFRILIKNLNNAEKEYMTVLYLCLLLLAFDDQKPIFLHD